MEIEPTLILILSLPALFLVSLLCVYRRARRLGTGRGLRLLLGNLLLLCLLSSILLAAGEMYYRYVCDETDGFALGLVSERWFSRHYSLNNRGIRDDVDYELRVRSGNRRLTFLGDSYSNGHGLREVEQRFVNILRESHPDWEIHFIGGDGNDTGHLLDSLRRWLGEGYQLDRVVYVYCLNDISDLMEEWQQASRRLYSEKPGWPFSHSYFLNTYYFRAKALLDPDIKLYYERLAAAYRDERWERQQERLNLLRELVAGHGGELLVVTFPFLELVGSAEYRAIHGRLAGFWSHSEVPHLDLTGTFERISLEDIRLNARDTHPNAEGHRLAAESIERFALLDDHSR